MKIITISSGEHCGTIDLKDMTIDSQDVRLLELWNCLKHTGTIEMGPGSDSSPSGSSDGWYHVPFTAETIGVFYTEFYNAGYKLLSQ